ncbi:non-ribosomal peptide synthetase [Stackebrandtia soli]|uniref:non-ribosomal peptide synthetase n=1 Tax=Stackebrandtia soli TaxID=1892856 RepID=UPI0039E8EC27
MTSELNFAPTRLRQRLTGPAGIGRVAERHLLDDAALAGLARISGGRPLEELVVVAAATALTVADLEHTTTPGVVVEGPNGRAVAGVDLSEAATFADLVRSVDASLRGGGGVDIDPVEAIVIASDRVIAADDGPALAITLSNEDGIRELRADADASLVETWFIGIVLRSIAVALAGFAQPRESIDGHDRHVGADVDTAVSFASADYDPTPAEETLLSPIATAAADRPDAVAVVSGNDTLTYGALWMRTEAVAARLAAAGVGAGDRVVVLTGKSTYAIGAILGVLRSGAAYVPLDNRWPAARVAAIMADVDASAIILDDALRGQLAESRVDLPVFDIVSVGDPDGAPTLSVPPPVGTDVAYLMYTSGSTGIPKGVIVRHGAIASYMRWKLRYHRLGPDTRILQTASLAFDGGTSDVFSVLSAGGALIMADMHSATPRELGDLAVRHAITDVNTVPSMYRLLLDELAGAASTLRLVTVGGEATTEELMHRHHATLPDTRLVNEYGPTEGSIAATAFDHGLDAGPGFPIGRPLDNTVVTVSTQDGRALPPGFVGELRLSGLGLADGYRNRPEQTASVFVADPLAPNGRAYRTGDLGWWRADGVLEFVGRADSQVKIRGQRVEIGEVENALGRVDGVAAAAVVATTGPDGGVALVGFVETPRLSPAEVHTAAAKLLPPAMLPSRIEVVPGLPRMASGKLNRAALERDAVAVLAAPVSVSAAAPADDVERVVGEVFGEVFGIDPCGPDTDFFILGGHSLMAVSAVGLLEDRLGVLLDLDDFLTAATVSGVAERLREAAPARVTQRAELSAVDDADVLGRLIDDLKG